MKPDYAKIRELEYQLGLEERPPPLGSSDPAPWQDDAVRIPRFLDAAYEREQAAKRAAKLACK